MEESGWFKNAKIGNWCGDQTRCESCQPNGDCDPCGTIDGRYMEVVNEYASSCDGCGELTHHDMFEVVTMTGLGLCWRCVQDGRTISDSLAD